jgi:aspartate racemase
MNSSTFQIPLGVRGIQVETPPEADRREIDRIIFKELLRGVTSTESQKFAARVIGELSTAKHCQAVILASSEAPLLIGAGASPLPVYHASEILARHAVRHLHDPE